MSGLDKMKALKERSLSRVNSTFIDLLTSNNIGLKIFNSLAEPYIAGHSLEEGLANIERYFRHRRHSTVDVLGESSTEIEKADDYLHNYKRIIDSLSLKNLNWGISSISLKPTAICAVNNGEPGLMEETPLKGRLEHIVSYAKAGGVDVTLDMEDSAWTDLSLDAAKYLWNNGYDNLGIVLQSRLNRTKEDIQKILKRQEYKVPKDKIRVRAVIGIYIEPENIATNNKPEAKERLIERVKELFDAGVYVEVGTHDHQVINRIIDEVILPKGINPERFEFQFLKGIQNAYAIERKLMGSGYKVRYYMPVEINNGDGIPYMERRLKANPNLILMGAKNMMQKMISYSNGS